jgi:hypothetical protein
MGGIKGQLWLLHAARLAWAAQGAQKCQQIRLPHRVGARFWLLLSMGRRDGRGAETIVIFERFSSGRAEPRVFSLSKRVHFFRPFWS